MRYLALLLVLQIISIIQNDGRYDTSYSLISEIVAGWLVALFSLISGLIIKIIMKFKKSKQIAELEKGDPSWDEIKEQAEANREAFSRL